MHVQEVINANTPMGTINDPLEVGKMVLRMAEINDLIDSKTEKDFIKLKALVTSLNIEKFTKSIGTILGDAYLNMLLKISYYHKEYLIEAVNGNRVFKLKIPDFILDMIPDACDLNYINQVIKDYYKGVENLQHGDVIQLNPITYGQVIDLPNGIRKFQLLPSPDWLPATLTPEQLRILDAYTPNGRIEIGLIGLASQYIPPQVLNSVPELEGVEIPKFTLPAPELPKPLKHTTVTLTIKEPEQKPGPKFIEYSIAPSENINL